MMRVIEMSKRIAVAGKGGVGKTTFTAVVINLLKKAGVAPVLAVDADPNANLHEYLGLKYEHKVSDIREELSGNVVPKGMSKSEYIEWQISNALVESSGVDLLVMGHPEGRGCYCFVNELLRGYLSKVAKNYGAVVTDNEAGLEHLSRRTTDNVDILYVISTPTVVGLKSVRNIMDTVRNVKLKIAEVKLVMNQVESLNWKLPAEFKDLLPYFDGIVRTDHSIASLAETGGAVSSLPEDSVAVNDIKNVLIKHGFLVI
ncbi:MAG: AAA family ATPase [Elusimicrobiota bacterium]